MSAEDRRWVITQPLYCRRCSQAEDMVPAYGERLPTTLDRGSEQNRREQRRRRSGRASTDGAAQATPTSELQARIEALLPELDGLDLRVWQMVCEGRSEKSIGAELGWSQLKVYDVVIRPLRLRCGLPVRRTRADYMRERRIAQAKA